MENIPEKIYLNQEPLSPMHMTWSEDKINHSDVEYLKVRETHCDKGTQTKSDLLLPESHEKVNIADLGNKTKEELEYYVILLNIRVKDLSEQLKQSQDKLCVKRSVEMNKNCYVCQKDILKKYICKDCYFKLLRSKEELEKQNEALIYFFIGLYDRAKTDPMFDSVKLKKLLEKIKQKPIEEIIKEQS